MLRKDYSPKPSSFVRVHIRYRLGLFTLSSAVLATMLCVSGSLTVASTGRTARLGYRITSFVASRWNKGTSSYFQTSSQPRQTTQTHHHHHRYSIFLSTQRLPKIFVSRKSTSRLMGRRMSSLSLEIDEAIVEQKTIVEQLEALEEETCKLNNAEPININSQKQVSQAIFGTEDKSTRREVLQKICIDVNLAPSQRRLAELVLEQRKLTTQLRAFDISCIAHDSNQEGESTSYEQDTQKPDDHHLEDDDAKSSEKTFDQIVDGLFGGNSKIDDYWRAPLLKLTKPTPRVILSQLNSTECPMGSDPNAESMIRVQTKNGGTKKKAGKLLEFLREQKIRHPQCVVLTRVGDFYECVGVDAILLMEHCGLNAMANKARAGCPYRNIQATLNGLTSKGFSVAVYEEENKLQWKHLKPRYFAQIVSPASPTYLHDLVLSTNADAIISSPAPRPYVGVINIASGYVYVEVSMEERTVRISERLTPEAVECRLAAYPPADPLIYVPSPSESLEGIPRRLPFLMSGSDHSLEGNSDGSRLRTKYLKPWQMQDEAPGVSLVDRAKQTIITELLKIDGNEVDSTPRVTVDEFAALSSIDAATTGTRTNPLYKETATQLGLMNDRAIPNLVSFLLPGSASAASKRFLKRWLLTPPPPEVADAMSVLVSYLKDQGPALPPLGAPSIGQVLARLRARQADVQVYREILRSIEATITVLEMCQSNPRIDEFMLKPLMVLLEHETGLGAVPDSLMSRCLEAKQEVDEVVQRFDEDPISNDFNGLLPKNFLMQNEEQWRGKVKPCAAQRAIDKVHDTANELARAVAVDFWALPGLGSAPAIKGKKTPIMQDIINNMIAIKDIPPSRLETTDYFHPKDRNGKELRTRYTTASVQKASSNYLVACIEARQEVANVLITLSEKMCDYGHLPAVVQAANANLILSTASNHAAAANTNDWHMAETYESSLDESTDLAGKFNGLIPYWMQRHGSVVENSFELDGMFLLTAPNMSGKSTLMRSMASAALLTNCGLCAPVREGSAIRRFDNIFLRGASADVPAEGKSAFGAEMGDIAALCRSCGEKSLVFVDELGRGTSPKDGTCIAGAVLEEMAKVGMNGVFATHLHDLFNLPLEATDRVENKRMSIHNTTESGTKTSGYVWTYKLEDGICTDSMALATAERFGLPQNIMERAQYFQSLVPDTVISQQASETEILRMSDSSAKEISSRATCNATGLEQAACLAQDLTGQPGKGEQIKPGWSPPAPMAEGQSCLYILELDVEPPRYYIGETDKLQRRLRQHRLKKGKGWKQASAFALPVHDKSEARRFESILIREMSKAGFEMESVFDG